MKKCASKSVLICILCFGLTIRSGFAGSATWQLDPISGDWDTAANWMPNTVPNGPSDTATFAVSNMTDVALSSTVEVDGIVFDTGASAFTITTRENWPLTVSGTGITNNSGVMQQFVAGSMRFQNTASAGELTTYILGGGITSITSFFGNSSADHATFLNSSAEIKFHESSTAANGSFILGGGSFVFTGSSTAANGSFTLGGGTLGGFWDRSSAGNATITVNGGETPGANGAELYFVNTSTADNCTIIANGGDDGAGSAFVLFAAGAASNMANATIIMNGGSTYGSSLVLGDNTNGGTARVAVYDNAVMTLFQTADVTIGSLEGNGRVNLDVNNLVVGSNNLSTTFSGHIRGRPGSGVLTKIGSGTLTLTRGNNYSGGTVVEAGVLEVANKNGSATGSGSVLVKAGTLAGKGIITGGVDVGGEPGLAAFLAPGEAAGGSRILRIAGALSFYAGANYIWNVQPGGAMADLVIANGVVIGEGALFSAVALDNGVLPVGIILTALNNTSATPISGTFANLPDGSTVTAGPNTYQVNYEGGDGNDFTLTVVP